MLAKLTAKNQITIPKNIIEHLPKVDYFDVELQDGTITLRQCRSPGRTPGRSAPGLNGSASPRIPWRMLSGGRGKNGESRHRHGHPRLGPLFGGDHGRVS